MKNNLEEKTKQLHQANPNYKDSLFKKVFSEKEDLLELFNAVSGRNCTDADELTIYTLEDVMYISKKNDLSFLIGDVLNLYEHQSTINPNMPIRGLVYLAKNLESYIAMNDINVHSSKLQKFPNPQYIVFYNGNEMNVERLELDSEEAFIEIEGLKPCINIKATLININYGHNIELLKKCKKLSEYSFFVSEVKKDVAEGHDLEYALDNVIDRCIKRGILTDILTKQRGEVRSMILAYTREKHEHFMKKEGREMVNKLNIKLLEENRIEDVKRAAVDVVYQNQLLKEYDLIDENEFNEANIG